MEPRKDYYKILGITDEEKQLPQEEFEKRLKKIFRTKALKLHPDKFEGKSEAEKNKAEEEFKEVSEAYSILSDAKKRAEYDSPQSNFQFDGGFGGMDINDILNQFGFGGFGGFGGFREQPIRQKGSSLMITIAVSLDDVVSGAKKKYKYKRYEVCGTCHGSGMTSESKKKTCSTCGGSGFVTNHNSFFSMHQQCPTCGGKGHIVENPCKKCHGHGIVEKNAQVEVDVPIGVEQGANLIKHGMGNCAPHGNGDNGDLIFTVVYKKDDRFDVDGKNIYFDLDINLVDAVLGCTKEVKTIDGKTLTAKIASGAYDGQMLGFKGYGLPSLNGIGPRGNMIGEIKIMIPKEINDKERELLEELRKQEHFSGDN